MGRYSKNDSSAMLLYEAPTGFAMFSFDGSYLNNPVEDFWASMPQLTLKVFVKYKIESTFIDLANEAIDDCLAKRLTMWCGSKKKLVVGSPEYKRIIEKNLGITCLYVDVPDDDPTKKDCLPMGEELMFLRQHDIDFKPEMVDKSVVEAAHLVHGIELRQKEHLKFFRILLKDFIVICGIDTEDWRLIHFATATKFICHPSASYQICHPIEIFSYDDEYLKIETNAPRYKRSFSKIDALAVYEDVLSHRTIHSVTLFKLGLWAERAKKLQEKAEEVTRLCQDRFSGEPALPTTDSYRLEAPSGAEPKPQVIPNQTYHCLLPGQVQEKLTENIEENKQAGDRGAQSMDGDGKQLSASTPVLLGNKQNEHTGTSAEETNAVLNTDEVQEKLTENMDEVENFYKAWMKKSLTPALVSNILQ